MNTLQKKRWIRWLILLCALFGVIWFFFHIHFKWKWRLHPCCALGEWIEWKTNEYHAFGQVVRIKELNQHALIQWKRLYLFENNEIWISKNVFSVEEVKRFGNYQCEQPSTLLPDLPIELSFQEIAIRLVRRDQRRDMVHYYSSF